MRGELMKCEFCFKVCARTGLFILLLCNVRRPTIHMVKIKLKCSATCVCHCKYLQTRSKYCEPYLGPLCIWILNIANFHGHALSAVSLINKSMKKSMSPVKVREFPEFGELHLCVIANR